MSGPVRTPPSVTATPAPQLAERELVALWLLGRTPAAVLPAGWTLLRPGRAGRGPGPDVREAAFRCTSGVVIAGDVEVHLRASDFAGHGHAADPAYGNVRLHLVWEDDRPLAGAPLGLPGGGEAPTAAVAPALSHDPARLRRAVARGASGGEPCAGLGARHGIEGLRDALRREGERRLAERVWGASTLVERWGWDGAWTRLLERALVASAGRRAGRAQPAAAAVTAGLCAGDAAASPLPALRAVALTGRPAALIEALRGGDAPLLGRARAAEVGWNAALPLLIAAAAAYDDAALAGATRELARTWPAPRPYGRTIALRTQLLDAAPSLGGGALAVQGLLHLQDLWCERGGCGVCPLTR